MFLCGKGGIKIFQSTLPVWGATIVDNGNTDHWYISIHAPRVGSDAGEQNIFLACRISIHAPRVGSDVHDTCGFCGDYSISIHAPRVGSDKTGSKIFPDVTDFNPRSPCGERPRMKRNGNRWKIFQSTLPVWGATEYGEDESEYILISIHAPRVGSDPFPGESIQPATISIHAPRVGSDRVREATI